MANTIVQSFDTEMTTTLCSIKLAPVAMRSLLSERSKYPSHNNSMSTITTDLYAALNLYASSLCYQELVFTMPASGSCR